MTGREDSLERSSAPPSATFVPTERYDAIRRIGAGGMGVVYEAFDRETRQVVALKTVQRFSPSALYQFKNEFRALADVTHPNLVRLFELVVTDSDQLFFTMELVRGVDFVRHTTRADAVSSGKMRRAAVTASEPASEPRLLSSRPPAREGRGPSPANLDRLRPSLRQLVEGVAAIHDAGKLHRDIKPSNVLVTAEGRVVLLDFGVATDIDAGLGARFEAQRVVGTATYMAPEQATPQQRAGPASDWYSVGVILYEVLVGESPFVGARLDVLTRKSLMDAPSPSTRADGVPEDLDVLCTALLRRDPASRPTGPEILQWLRGGTGRSTPISPLPPGPVPGVRLVGRTTELAELERAFGAARAGRFVTLRVHGSSGMGKSALASSFVDELAHGGRALVLYGRAYERESMPYKGLDGIVDAISRRLIEIDGGPSSFKLPEGIGALARLFPVLRRVDRIAVVPDHGDVSPTAVWQRAAVAFRELLGRLAADKPLALYIDDVQWGDVDSAQLLAEVARPPFASQLLLVLTYRDEEIDSSPFLLEMRARWPRRTDVRDIALAALDEEDACRLATSILDRRGAASEVLARSIARESLGNPLLVEELARHVVRSAESVEKRARTVRLEDVLEERIALLSDEARRMVELLAICARPLPVAILGDAAGVTDRLAETIAVIRARRFVRTGFRAGRDTIEMLHDRIREAIVAALPGEVIRSHHGRLARVLESLPERDPEAIAMHLFGSGESDRAGRYAEQAAENAVAKLAFAEAMRLYDLALTTVSPASADARRLRMRMAELLERSGRGVGAADAYRAAAELATGLERIGLQGQAARQLLTAGRMQEGAEALDRVLRAAGLRPPRSVLGALFSLLATRLVLRLRGLDFQSRELADVRRIDHLRIEALYTFVIGINIVNLIYGASVQARHLLLALRGGSRLQLVRAVALDAANIAARGGRESAYERGLWAIVKRLVDESGGDADFIAWTMGVRGVSEFFRGQWRQARLSLATAVEVFPRATAGWHSNASLFAIYSLGFLGEVRELRLQLLARLAEAQERGDLYTSVNLRIGHVSLCWLASDEVDVARLHLREAMESWSQRGYTVQHYRAMLAEAHIELYAGHARRAYAAVAREWRPLQRSLLMISQYLRCDAYALRARCALASLGIASNRSRRLAEAERFAGKLGREDMVWTRPMAALLWAGTANSRGDRDGAIRHLRTAIDSAQRADMALYAGVARLRLGSLLGGAEGDSAGAEARDWMQAQQIRDPGRIAAVFAPGFAGD